MWFLTKQKSYIFIILNACLICFWLVLLCSGQKEVLLQNFIVTVFTVLFKHFYCFIFLHEIQPWVYFGIKQKLKHIFFPNYSANYWISTIYWITTLVLQTFSVSKIRLYWGGVDSGWRSSPGALGTHIGGTESGSFCCPWVKTSVPGSSCLGSVTYKPNVVSVRMQVWSLALLSGLRIQGCHNLQCRWQMWFGSCIAVAVV